MAVSFSFLCLLVVFVITICCDHFTESTKPPHILLMLADDLGWYDVGYHNPKIQTPNIDKLAKEGVTLDQYYVQQVCTPTRGALMTGRYPIHTGLQRNVIHPRSPFGLPLDFELLPKKLKEAGYATHLVGKWHLGFYKWAYVPTKRGFDSAYGFWDGSQGHFNHERFGVVDFRDNLEPVWDLNGTYAANAYVNRVEKIVKAHDPSQPLFMYMAFQNVHAPNQAPKNYIKKYEFIKNSKRRVHAAMADILDTAVGNITQAFREAGLWNDTVLIFSTDNGGKPVYGGYNWPLRGKKGTVWEGGVRGVGFVHSTLLARKGETCKELLHVTDWYPTILKLAGLPLKDSSPKPLDGFDVWETISVGKASPRTEILLNINHHTGTAFRMGEMKLLLNVSITTWFKPPELKQKLEKRFHGENKECNSAKVCRIPVALYNLTADPEERIDLSETLPDVVKKMHAKVKTFEASSVKPLYRGPDPQAMKTAKRNGIWCPWKD